MPRSRKARAEGAAAKVIVVDTDAPVIHEELVDEAAPKLANPVPGDDGEALARITASFAERFPEEWEQWRLGPLAGGLEAMAEKLKGNG